jgi:hypothetical protein
MSVAPAPSSGVRPLLGPVAVRLAMGCFVIALGASQTTCRLDKLIKPAIADRLTVSPDSLRDSAHVGSSATDTVMLRIASADGATLPWSATKTAAWVTLSPTLGGAPDSVVVILDPDALSQGLHQDTIVFTSAQTNDTVRVPVSFEILPPAPELSVSSTSITDSAFLGSASPRTFTLLIDNTGALPLNWGAVVDSAWLALSKDSGGAPPLDSTIVTLTPGVLAVGTHTGTVTVTAPGAIGSPAAVTVSFTIRPCAETGITPDIIVTASIALSDCGAPQRPGRQAKLYAVQANAGDTLSFRLTSAAFNEYLILTNSTGVVVYDSSDVCLVDVTKACLTYTVPTTGRYLIEATTKDSGETGAFTLSAVKELSPSAPAPGQFRANGTTAIAVGAITPESTVVFKATLNDPNPFDSVRLEVEVEGLATGIVTDSSAFVPRGTSVSLPVTGLHDNEGYHWRARTCDKTGRCSTWFSFGGNVDPAADFVVNWQPENPTIGALSQVGPSGSMPVGGGTGGTYPNSVTVTFKAGVTDLDPGDLISIEAEHQRTGTNFDSTTTRGGGVASRDTAAVSVSIPVQVLNLTANFHWRARVCDQTNRCSAWVSFGGNPEADVDFHVP